MKLLRKAFSPTVTTSQGVKVFIDVETDGETLYVSMTGLTSGYSGAYMTIGYNGEEGSIYVYGAVPGVLTFTYDSSVKSLSYSVDSVSNTLSWSGDFDDPAPTVSVSYTGVRQYEDSTFSFTFSGETEHNAFCGATVYYRDYLGNWTYECATVRKSVGPTGSFYAGLCGGSGSVVKVILGFGCYRTADAAVGDYIGITLVQLPLFTMTALTPYAPCELKYDPVPAGQPITVTWHAVDDPDYPVEEYSLKRSFNNADPVLVYRGTDTSFTEITPVSAKTVRYQVASICDLDTSVYTRGNVVSLQQSNISVGVGTKPKTARAVYVGKNGKPVKSGAVVSVG